MLRLIDIVLILLFGFISISHIDRSIAVELPQAEFMPRIAPDFENWAVVTVDEHGTWICGFDRTRISGVAELSQWMASEQRNGVTHVRLRVDRNRPSSEVALLQGVCEELDMALALEVILSRGERP